MIMFAIAMCNHLLSNKKRRPFWWTKSPSLWLYFPIPLPRFWKHLMARSTMPNTNPRQNSVKSHVCWKCFYLRRVGAVTASVSVWEGLCFHSHGSSNPRSFELILTSCEPNISPLLCIQMPKCCKEFKKGNERFYIKYIYLYIHQDA